ncbi:MAG: hypothetical protein WBW62_07460 [Solirubrobacterales bacterium]
MALGEARPGYELWRPNRSKSGSITARFAVMLLLLISALLMLIIVIGGWDVLIGGGTFGIYGIVFALVYILLAVMIGRWSRGALTLAIAFAVLLLIFCAVGAESWFARDKSGFTDAALPSDLIGLLVIILIPIQALLVIVSAIAFNQQWHVEEERPLEGTIATPREVKPSRGSGTAEKAPRSAARSTSSEPT